MLVYPFLCLSVYETWIKLAHLCPKIPSNIIFLLIFCNKLECMTKEYVKFFSYLNVLSAKRCLKEKRTKNLFRGLLTLLQPNNNLIWFYKFWHYILRMDFINIFLMNLMTYQCFARLVSYIGYCWLWIIGYEIIMITNIHVIMINGIKIMSFITYELSIFRYCFNHDYWKI